MPILVKLNVSGGKEALRGRAYLWSVIRGFDGEFTPEDIHGLTNGERRSSIRVFLDLLKRAGYVEEVGTSACGKRRYKTIKRPPTLPPLTKDGRPSTFGAAKRQMWNIMRSPSARAGFTSRDLVFYGSTDETPVSRYAATAFIRTLFRAGYLVDLGRRRYRLKPSMNSGPLPPIVMAGEIVWDQNRKTVAGEAIVEERP
jgi:hypothetical protein